jgi:hypothetical protein
VVLFWKNNASSSARSRTTFTERAPGRVTSRGSEARASKSARQPMSMRKSGAASVLAAQAPSTTAGRVSSSSGADGGVDVGDGQAVSASASASNRAWRWRIGDLVDGRGQGVRAKQ